MIEENFKVIHFDHDGEFELSTDNDIIVVDINLVQRIVFRDHQNKIQYTFSKMRTELIDDLK